MTHDIPRFATADGGPSWQPGDPVHPNLVDAVRCPDCMTHVIGPGSRPPMQCPECGGAMEAIEEPSVALADENAEPVDGEGSVHSGPHGAAEDDLYERLAAIEHERWADWQRWVHLGCHRSPDGSLTIPARLVERRERQMATPYAELTEAEKDSDRKQVDRYWPLVVEVSAERDAARAEAEALRAKLRPLVDRHVGCGAECSLVEELGSVLYAEDGGSDG